MSDETSASALAKLRDRQRFLTEERSVAEHRLRDIATRLDEIRQAIELVERGGRRKPGPRPGRSDEIGQVNAYNEAALFQPEVEP